MTTVPKASWRATIAPPWRKFSSTLPAAVSGRPRHERNGASPRHLVEPHRRDDPALLVSSTLVLAAAPGIDVLAGAAGDHLGFPANIHRAECQLLRARRRHADRRRYPVGHPVSRTARLFHLLS